MHSLEMLIQNFKWDLRDLKGKNLSNSNLPNFGEKTFLTVIFFKHFPSFLDLDIKMTHSELCFNLDQFATGNLNSSFPPHF